MSLTALTEPTIFESVAADVMSRVTVDDHSIVYTVRRVDTWQLIEHRRKNDWTGPPRMRATTPAGLIVVNPALSPDGRILFFESRVMLFTSIRPGGREGWDIYVARKSSTGWSTPQNVGAPVNTPGGETGPTLSQAFDPLFFLRNTGGARKVYSVPFTTSTR